jgi:hypothetical protein
MVDLGRNYLIKELCLAITVLDLGWRNRSNFNNNAYDDNAIKLTCLYQWVWNIDAGFNWYVIGGGVGSYRSYDNNTSYNDTFVFAAGDIGIEYNFDIRC